MSGESPPVPRSSYVWLAVALVLVGAVLFGIWRGLASLESGVAAAVIAASATVLISVFSVIYSKRWEQARTIQEGQREHKRGVYEEFMHFWFRTIASDSLGEEQPDEAEILRFMATFNQKLILWGSDELLAEYVRFRQVAAIAEDGEGSPEAIFAFERLLYAIRTDLGHSNKGLGAGDLLRLFINDIDTVLAA